MREYIILCCILGAVGCGGARGGAAQDSVPRDSAVVGGPPAVPASSESVTSRPRSRVGVPDPNAKQSPSPVAPAAAGDSVRGIVSVVGTDRDQHVMIARPGGGKRIEITGPVAALIKRVAGADVSVVGKASGTSLEAARFVVKTVDGDPALDGTLKVEGASLFLIQANGTRTRIVAPPPPLMDLDGVRVWITGDPSRGVASFGRIDPPR